jgi:hypothetical protein
MLRANVTRSYNFKAQVHTEKEVGWQNNQCIQTFAWKTVKEMQ